MNDYYLNRINMGRKVFACLDAPDHEPLWKNQPPLRLTAAVAEGRVLLTEEADDYDALIVAPDEAINRRVIATEKVSGAYAAFADKLDEIGDLLLPLRATVAGAELVAAYEQARTINDRGRRPGEDPVPPTPTPPQAP